MPLPRMRQKSLYVVVGIRRKVKSTTIIHLLLMNTMTGDKNSVFVLYEMVHKEKPLINAQ